MKSIALVLLGLIAAVALVGMINLDSNTGMFMTRGNMVLSGSIYDQDGYVLYTNKQTRQSRLVNSIVAVAPDGRVIGNGQVTPGQYKMTMYGEWRDTPVVEVQIGVFNAARPDQNSLVPCTTINMADILNKPGRRSGGQQQLDLYCNIATMQKASTMRYR